MTSPQFMKLTGLSAAVAVCMALGACKGHENYGNDTVANAGVDTGVAAGAMAPAPGSTATAMPIDSMSDANIFAVLDQANQGEVEAGRLATDKATAAGVRAFAQRMVRDHSNLRQKGQQLAKQLNVSPEPPSNFQMPQQQQALMDSLRNTPKGAAFDSTYINRQVTLHEQTVDELKKLQDAADQQQLKDLIDKAIPTIQDHLDQARKVQDNLKTRT
jgi:putative membrane protein